MKKTMSVFATVLASIGHLMSQPVANLEAPVGTQLRTFFRDDVPNNSVVKLLAGSYTVTPSILNSNLTVGNQFTGISLANKTNVTILGVPGQSIIDGSSAPGEVFWMSNCSRITIQGVTFRGYTNHNFLLMPLNGVLWAGVNLFKSEHVTFDNCRFERHFDHGLQDKGAEINSAVASFPPSTNNILVKGCSFEDIGSWRNNGGGVVGVDGASIVCTGWTIENCRFDFCQRGIEPYDEGDANGQVFHNTVIRDNVFRNMVEFAIGTAGSTNCHNALVTGNVAHNEFSWSHHGSNYSAGLFPSYCSAYIFNGGRGWTVTDNTARGNMANGFIFGNSLSFCDEFLVENNTASDINDNIGTGVGFFFGPASVDTAAMASSCRRFQVRGNKAFNVAGNAFLIDGVRDFVFENNYSTRGCLYTVAGDAGIANFRFGRSGFVNCRLTNIIVRGNTAHDAGVGSSYGFGIQNNVQSMLFEGNNAYNFTQGAMTNRSGAAVTVLGSPRTFTADIDLPSIGVGSQFTTNFTATGVSTNDACTINIPAQFYASGNTTNIVFSSWCSNAAVYLKFANNDTVTAADAPNVRMTATVRQFQAE